MSNIHKALSSVPSTENKHTLDKTRAGLCKDECQYAHVWERLQFYTNVNHDVVTCTYILMLVIPSAWTEDTI